MRANALRISLLAVLVLLAQVTPPVYADSEPLEHLKINLASVQQVLTDPNLAGNQHFHQRRKLMRVVLDKLFDFQEMSRRALGANARRYKDRLGEFTPLFTDFLEYAYMGILEENGDAKIRYLDEKRENDYAQVSTRTQLRDGSEYRVDYKFHHHPMGWRAYDVTVEGISLVNNYRSQFDRILNRISFDELLDNLREKKEKFN